jgi:hypothetical protein
MKRERAAYRVIPEKSDPATGLHYVACPLCGADQPRALLTSRDYYNNLSGEFGVVRCRECGFTYTNPRPFGARLAAYYPDSAAYYNATTRPEPRALQAALETGSMRRRLRRLGYPAAAAAPASVAGLPYRILKYAIPPAVGGGAALEVGCAAGGFLYQLQCLGWTCRGLELNQAAAEHARSVLGLHVTQLRRSGTEVIRALCLYPARATASQPFYAGDRAGHAAADGIRRGALMPVCRTPGFLGQSGESAA